MSHGRVGTESGVDTQSYSSLPNKVVGAGNGVDYAYRDVARARCRWSCRSTSVAISTTGTRP
jgi:hypothetical protein